jgi:hypothetical protein
VQSLVQAGAIVAAGGWAYLKYLKGQPFSSRAQLSVAATMVELGDLRALSVQVELRNVGERRMDLGEKTVSVYGVTRENWTSSEPVQWGAPLAELPTLDPEEWVEPQEGLSDELLVPVPQTLDTGPDAILAYKVVVDVEQVKPRISWMHAQTMLAPKERTVGLGAPPEDAPTATDRA